MIWMISYGNYLKKFQTGIPLEFHPEFCKSKISSEFLKEQLKVVDFCCKIHSEWLMIHLCLATTLGGVLFCFVLFNSGKQNELNISGFSSSSRGFTPIYVLLCFGKRQCLRGSSWRDSWQKEVSANSYKNAGSLGLKRHWDSSALIQKVHDTALGRESCLGTTAVFTVECFSSPQVKDDSLD